MAALLRILLGLTLALSLDTQELAAIRLDVDLVMLLATVMSRSRR